VKLPGEWRCGQIRRPPFGQSVARHVVTQRIQRDEKRVVRPDQVSRVKHLFNPFSHRSYGFGFIHYIRLFAGRRKIQFSIRRQIYEACAN
jgi:hypothetical protein